MKTRVYLLLLLLVSSLGISQSSLLAPTQNNQANKLFGEKRYQEALDIYLKLYEKDPENAELAFNLANTYQALEDPEKAELFYEKAFNAENPTTRASAQFNSGLMYMKNQKLDPAIDRFVNYLRQHPEDQDAKRNLEIALKAQQNQQQNKDQNQNSDKNQDEQKNQNGQGQQNQDQQDQQNQQDQQDQQNQQDQQDQQNQQNQQNQQDQEDQKDPSKDSQSNQNQQKDSDKEKKSQESQQQNGKTGPDQEADPSEQAQSSEETAESEKIKEQILSALKEQEAQQQKQFLQRKSQKGQRKSKDW